MDILSSLDNLPTLTQPCGLTFGSFDGVHLGHQTLFRHLRTLLPPKSLIVVLAFSTHPSLVFTHKTPPCLLTTLEHKLKLLAETEVDIALSIPFTKEIASWTYDRFLETLHQKLHFSHLVLGENASFGQGRKGTQEHVSTFAPRLGFQATYLPKQTIDGTVVSSGHIRNLIAQGELAKAAHFLGRPYSISISPLQPSRSAFHFPNLCLPPSGSYTVQVHCKDQTSFMTKIAVQKEQAEVHILQTQPLVNPVELVFI